MPYRPYLNSQFSDAYDIYLKILHCVDRCLNEALVRNMPNWRLLNTCPCCSYKLQDKPPQVIDWLFCIDGNNSLKRWASSTYGLTPRQDSRQACSDYWVDQATVDKFKDMVRRSEVCLYMCVGNRNRCELGQANADDWENHATEQVGPESNFNCTERWRNAGPEQRKKMFLVFDESGIFIAACRHRFVLLACDMVWSGELCI
jgi:hypothetical protein